MSTRLRLVAAAILGSVGFVITVAALAVPLGTSLDPQASTDPTVRTVSQYAGIIAIIGIAHLIVAAGLLLDNRLATAAAAVFALIAAVACVAGLRLIVSGHDPLAASSSSGSSTSGVGMVGAALVGYVVAFICAAVALRVGDGSRQADGSRQLGRQV
jgi:hypothetical protein